VPPEPSGQEFSGGDPCSRRGTKRIPGGGGDPFSLRGEKIPGSRLRAECGRLESVRTGFVRVQTRIETDLEIRIQTNRDTGRDTLFHREKPGETLGRISKHPTADAVGSPGLGVGGRAGRDTLFHREKPGENGDHPSSTAFGLDPSAAGGKEERTGRDTLGLDRRPVTEWPVGRDTLIQQVADPPKSLTPPPAMTGRDTPVERDTRRNTRDNPPHPWRKGEGKSLGGRDGTRAGERRGFTRSRIRRQCAACVLRRCAVCSRLLGPANLPKSGLLIASRTIRSRPTTLRRVPTQPGRLSGRHSLGPRQPRTYNWEGPRRNRT
jgi:hypothetical protein